jgi:hypothetical protein
MDPVTDTFALETALEASKNVGKGFFNILIRFVKYFFRYETMTKSQYYEAFYYGPKPYFEKTLGKNTEAFFAAENEFYNRMKSQKNKTLSLAELNDIIENAKTTVFINHLKR